MPEHCRADRLELTSDASPRAAHKPRGSDSPPPGSDSESEPYHSSREPITTRPAALAAIGRLAPRHEAWTLWGRLVRLVQA